MRAETLLLQEFKFPILFVVSPSTTSRRRYLEFLLAFKFENKVDRCFFVLLNPLTKRMTFISSKSFFRGSRVRASCSQIFLVNPHMHNRDTTLEDHGEMSCPKLCCEAAKTTRQKSYLHICGHMKIWYA
jgi:hypothetical protein